MYVCECECVCVCVCECVCVCVCLTARCWNIDTKTVFLFPFSGEMLGYWDIFSVRQRDIRVLVMGFLFCSTARCWGTVTGRFFCLTAKFWSSGTGPRCPERLATPGGGGTDPWWT